MRKYVFRGSNCKKKIPKIFRAYGAPPPWEMCTYTTDLRYIAMKKPVAYIGLMKGGGRADGTKIFADIFCS